jgi:hypothetical protein
MLKGRRKCALLSSDVASFYFCSFFQPSILAIRISNSQLQNSESSGYISPQMDFLVVDSNAPGHRRSAAAAAGVGTGQIPSDPDRSG